MANGMPFLSSRQCQKWKMMARSLETQTVTPKKRTSPSRAESGNHHLTQKTTKIATRLAKMVDGDRSEEGVL